MIIIINKVYINLKDKNIKQIDSVPLENVIGWKNYFESNFKNLKVVFFTSFPKDPFNFQSKDGKGI